MKYLLDTAPFLWMLFDDREHISDKAFGILSDPRSKLFLSAASTWEIAIKYSLGKLKLKKAPSSWLPSIMNRMDLQMLPIHIRHTMPLMNLPWKHKDPFDRLLVSQAMAEGLKIISPDKIFRQYKVPLIW